MPRCFAYCNIKELRYNATYIPYDCFKGFKGKIVFTKELQEGSDVFKPLLQLSEESEIDVASWNDYDRARKYYNGKITVNGETLRINSQRSTFVSIEFGLTAYGSTTIADVQKVTVGDTSVPLTPDGKYVVNNLVPGTEYEIKVSYKGEDGGIKEAIQTVRTKYISELEINQSTVKEYIAGVKMQLTLRGGEEDPYDLSQSNATYGVQLYYNEEELEYKLTDPDADGYYFFKNLLPGKEYYATPYLESNGHYYFSTRAIKVSTKMPELKLSYRSYPTAIEFYDSESSSDVTYEAKKVRWYFDENCTKTGNVYTDLLPAKVYYFWLKIDDSDLADYKERQSVVTKPLNYTLNIYNVTPTTFFLRFYHERAAKYEPDLKFVLYWANDTEMRPIEESFTLTGLSPNSKYTIYIKAFDAKTNRLYSTQEAWNTTKPLTLETEAPKIPSAGNMIARATTNISELEPNVGFQWKKYDAPESLKPSEGFAVAYGGVLEGTIHNLQIDHYYNVRAFYRDMNGKEYYGKWITVDPSDFSWFEPNVHTYDVDRVTTNGAKARGYVVQGTDDIEKQGFEYWPSGETSKRRVAYGTYAPADNGRRTILATGQLMTAELADLLSGTEYTVRSFVTTSASTYYGEEITFRTLEASGIEGVAVDEAEIVPVAYYRLDGTRGERPFAGLNMVVFSDGHVEKIVFK